MKILELFSGTHSIGKVCQILEKIDEIVSLDRDLEGLNDHKHFKIDIHDFDYQQYPHDYFDIIWSSPVCAFWSILKNSNVGHFSKRYDQNLNT